MVVDRVGEVASDTHRKIPLGDEIVLGTRMPAFAGQQTLPRALDVTRDRVVAVTAVTTTFGKPPLAVEGLVLRELLEGRRQPRVLFLELLDVGDDVTDGAQTGEVLVGILTPYLSSVWTAISTIDSESMSGSSTNDFSGSPRTARYR